MWAWSGQDMLILEFKKWKNSISIASSFLEFVIGSATVSALLKRFEDQLSSNDDHQIKIASVAVRVLIDNISDNEASKSHETLVFNLLKPLFVNILLGRGDIVYDTWKKGVLLVSKNHKLLIEHVTDMASQIGKYISSRLVTLCLFKHKIYLK